jgi:long-subunit fatty acid transport protein
MRSTRVLIAALLLCTAAATAQEQAVNVSKRGTSAAPFLSIQQGARATAMGSAFVALASDPSALFWNPAGIARLDGIQVMFDHTLWIADINYNYFAVSFDIGDIGAVGASVTSSAIDEMNVTTVAEPNGTGQIFKVQDVAASLAVALNLTENFSIGFNPKFISQSIWDASATAFAIDMGILYRTPFEGFTIGMAMQNFGPKMKMDGQSLLVLYDANIESSGNNGRIPANLETDEWALPLYFRFGVAWTPVLGDMHKLNIEADAVVPSDNYQSVNLGAEYIFNDMFAVRAGYKSLFLDESEESFTLGAGVQHRFVGNLGIKVDYAYQDFGRLANVQKFTVSMTF